MVWKNGRSKKEHKRLDRGAIQNSGIKGISAKRSIALARQSSAKVKRTAVTSNYTVVSSDYLIGVNSSAGALTVTLPTATTVGAGRLLVIKDEGGLSGSGKTITIAGAGSQTIDGSATRALKTNYSCVHIYSTGSGWAVIDSDHLDGNHQLHNQVFG